MEKQPFVSVVIPTYNRGVLLRECLNSLLSQTYPQDSYEIIVVDDGSTDTTQYVLEEYSKNEKVGFSWVSQPNQGCGIARQTGVKKARGEILCFTDDDCTPTKDWIYSIVKCFKSDDNIGGVGGKIIAFKPNSIIERYARKNQFFNQELHTGYFITANASYKKIILDKVGGFDPYMLLCEDLDLSIQTQLLGYSLKYCPEAIVYHKHRSSLRNLAKQMFGYGISFSRLHNKYPRAFNILSRGFLMSRRFFMAIILLPLKMIKNMLIERDKILAVVEPFIDVLVLSSHLSGTFYDFLFGEKYPGKIIYDELKFFKY